MDLEDIKKYLKEQSEILNVPHIKEEAAELLRFLPLTIKGKNALEIGTGVGYSACWLLEGITGELITIEKDKDRVDFAEKAFKSFGIERIEILHGDALKIVPEIKQSFDVIYQDGPKGQYINMLNILLDRLTLGGLLITDNVLFRKYGTNGISKRYSTIIKRLDQYILELKNSQIMDTIILPVGDGLAISRKKE
jgi:predicted O-methyltransferase YrrM